MENILWLSLISLFLTVTTGAIVRRNICRARDYCVDNDGTRRTLQETWDLGQLLCWCAYPDKKIYFEDGRHQYHAEMHCQLNGCRSPHERQLLKEGDVFFNDQHDVCECRNGTIPVLPTPATLYHAVCYPHFNFDMPYYMDFHR